MINHATPIRALREQPHHLTRHVEPSRETWGEVYMLARVVTIHALALLGVGYLAGAL